MACAQIQAEIVANNKAISDLGSEKGAKVAQNVAAGVVGILIWPVWFAMDFKGAAATDQAALESRNQYLATMANTDRCGTQQPVTTAVASQPAVIAPAFAAQPQPAVSCLRLPPSLSRQSSLGSRSAQCLRPSSPRNSMASSSSRWV